MAKLTAAEVIDTVNWLKSDADGMRMRREIQERWKLLTMEQLAELPEHYSRGTVVSVPSPRVNDLVNSIMADRSSYPTTTTIIPHSADDQKRADEAEKLLAVVRSKLDDGYRVSGAVGWHQEATGYGVMILNCLDPADEDGKLSWSVSTPSPDAVYFPYEGGPARPSLLAWEYEQLITTTESMYSGKPKNEAKGRQLRRSKEGKWDFHPVSADFPVDSSSGLSLSSHGKYEKAKMYWLATEEYTYHVALNKGNKDGALVWCRDNRLTGGVPAVIIPGHINPMREMYNAFQAAQWPAMQMVKLINMVRAIRMTKSLRIQPDALIEQSPELQGALQGLGLMHDATAYELETGGPNIINVGGRPYFWTMPPDEDLDKLEQSFNAELQEYISTALSVTTAATLEKSTANGILAAVGVRRRQQGPRLRHLDWAWAQILEMVKASVLYEDGGYDMDFSLYPKGGERYSKGELKAGGPLIMNREGMDFGFDIVVMTESITEEERRAAVQDWMVNKGARLSTNREGIGAAGYTDEMAQIEALAEDEAIEAASSRYDGMIAMVAAEMLRLEGGPDLSQFGEVLAPAAQPAGASRAAEPMREPVVNPVHAGSNGAQPRR